MGRNATGSKHITQSKPDVSDGPASLGRAQDRGAWRLAEVEAEAAPSRLVEVLPLEPVGPGALVLLGREIARARPGEERLPDAGPVLLVARAPGRGGDVHDVAPAPLVGDGRDAVDHV